MYLQNEYYLYFLSNAYKHKRLKTTYLKAITCIKGIIITTFANS